VHSAHGGLLGSDAALGRVLSADEAAELGDASLTEVGVLAGGGTRNPWAGAGRRARGDVVVAQPGCGGAYRRAARSGDRVRLRYVARKGGVLVDSTRGRLPVDLLLGSSQAGAELDRALMGLCAGEAVRVQAAGGVELVVAVLEVGAGISGRLQGLFGAGVGHGGEVVGDAEDRLARDLIATPGARGRSCATACRTAGLVCAEAGFAVINTCPRLREAFECAECEVAAAGTAGPDMPCYVSKSAPVGHPRGFCMVNPVPTNAQCDSKYKHTRRLCPCLKA
jgi:hypothetical protein